jgi:hypothetical protein
VVPKQALTHTPKIIPLETKISNSSNPLMKLLLFVSNIPISLKA